MEGSHDEGPHTRYRFGILLKSSISVLGYTDMGEKIRTELPEEEYERLVQIAEKTGKSLSQVLREAVNEYTSRHEEVDQKTAEKTDEYLYGER